MKPRTGLAGIGHHDRSRWAAIALAALGLAMGGLEGLAGCATRPNYPDARRDQSVVDTRFGTRVADPYRWMEATTAPETQDWIKAENTLFARYVAGPTRDSIKARLTAVWNYDKYSPPHREGDRYFFDRWTGLGNQPVICSIARLGPLEKPHEILDPNVLSPDGTVAVSTQAFSHDGTLLAYGLSTSGSDRQEIYVRDTRLPATAKDRPDVLKWTKFTTIGWAKDNSGFYYNRYPEPGTVPADEENSHCKVYWHVLGTTQDKDKLVLERPDDKTLDLYPYVTDDGAFLCVGIVKGTAVQNRFWYRPAAGDPGRADGWVRLLDNPDASYSFIDNVGGVFYFQTNLDASRGRIIAIDTAHPEKANWKTVVPESADTLGGASIINNQLVLVYLHDAYHVVKIHNLDGAFVRDIPLPGVGSIDGLTGRRADKETFFMFSSYALPASIYRYDFTTGQVELYHRSEIKVDFSGYETKLVSARSKDGTRVPMFVTSRKGVKLDGNNLVYLTGYGAYGINVQPGWSSARLPWLERGGIYVEVILRGGGEYGESWHQAGMLANKQHTFDDFEAAAQYLIDQHYTTGPKLVAEGGSAGGLMVAACALQRPDLFGAVVCDVPVTDMVRLTRFANGPAQTPEFGDATADATQLNYLLAYSPLHNVKPGVTYPPMLVTTADSDDRVDPSHSFKFVATLQWASGLQSAPAHHSILLRVDTNAGHGDGKPTAKIIDELADSYAFIFRTLGQD